MKKIVLLGANGHTAREITACLLEQKDVELTLFSRRSDRLRDLEGLGARIVEGDAKNLNKLRQVVRGQDIVIGAMGGMDLGETMAGVVKVMEELGVRRIVTINAGGIYDELPEPFNSWDKAIVGNTRPTNLRAADVIEASSLDYTILRPVWLTDKKTEAVQLTAKGEMYKGTETSRRSLARFVADLVKDPQHHINENLGISQPHTDGDKPAAYR